jgi:hypothetical protein
MREKKDVELFHDNVNDDNRPMNNFVYMPIMFKCCGNLCDAI